MGIYVVALEFDSLGEWKDAGRDESKLRHFFGWVSGQHIRFNKVE